MSSRERNAILRLLPFLGAVAVLASGCAGQWPAGGDDLSAELTRQRRELERQRQEIAELRSRLPLGEPLATAEAGTLRGGQAPPAGPAPAPGPAAPAPEGPVGERPPEPEKRPGEIALLDEIGGGVLLRKGQMSLEPSVEFAHTSTDRFIFRGVEILPAFLIGVFDINEADRDSVFGTLAGRLGVTDRTEVELRVPYVYRGDRLTTTVPRAGGDATVRRDIDGHGLGDVELAVHHQFNASGGELPAFVGNLRLKTPTGTDPFEVGRDSSGLETELASGSGFWAIEPSVTAILPSDPAVFFANVGYLWNLRRDVDKVISGARVGEVDPGDAIRASFGLGFSINERASFSLGYDHSYLFDTTTEVNGVESSTDGTHVGSLLFGVSYRPNERVGLNLSLAVGVTEDAPDVRVTLRVPISMKLF